jgi:hypothetical protein
MSTKKDGGNKDGPPIIVITKDGNPPKKRAYYPTPMTIDDEREDADTWLRRWPK